MMMNNLTIEDEIYLNASANSGLEKDKKKVIQNLKLNYAIAGEEMKGQLKGLIRYVEGMSQADFDELISQMPFETGVPDDILHEETYDYDE